MNKIKGFTLVELLDTVVILSIVALIIVPNIIKYQKKIGIEKVRTAGKYRKNILRHRLEKKIR